MSAFDKHIGHRRHFSTHLLSEVVQGAGLEVARLSGAGFPFFNLYRLMVVARGEALIKDVDLSGAAPLPRSARLAMRAFDWLFRWNRTETLRGWQILGEAREPQPPGRAVPS